MKSVVLSSEEINIINDVVLFLSENILVESVFIIAHELNGSETVELHVIRNNSINYCKKLIGQRTIPNFSKWVKELDDLVLKIQSIFDNKRISIHLSDADIYSRNASSYTELSAVRNLISSIILFDRFGDISKKKFSSKGYIIPYNNSLEIENYNQLLPKNNLDTGIVIKQKKYED